jgi:hypothetical protein
MAKVALAGVSKCDLIFHKWKNQNPLASVWDLGAVSACSSRESPLSGAI